MKKNKYILLLLLILLGCAQPPVQDTPVRIQCVVDGRVYSGFIDYVPDTLAPNCRVINGVPR